MKSLPMLYGSWPICEVIRLNATPSWRAEFHLGHLGLSCGVRVAWTKWARWNSPLHSLAYVDVGGDGCDIKKGRTPCRMRPFFYRVVYFAPNGCGRGVSLVDAGRIGMRRSG